MYTDASDNCIGACLTQKTDEGEENPIYYISHKLNKTQEKWSTIERETYAIQYALQKLDHYLHNATFTIKTDHKPLKYIGCSYAKQENTTLGIKSCWVQL